MDRKESNRSGGFSKDNTAIITASKMRKVTGIGSSDQDIIMMKRINGLYMDFLRDLVLNHLSPDEGKSLSEWKNPFLFKRRVLEESEVYKVWES